MRSATFRIREANPLVIALITGWHLNLTAYTLPGHDPDGTPPCERCYATRVILVPTSCFGSTPYPCPSCVEGARDPLDPVGPAWPVW